MLKKLLITSTIVGLTLNEVSAMEQQTLTSPDIYAILPYHMHPESRQNWATSHKAAAEGVSKYKELTQSMGFTHMKIMCPSIQELKQAWKGKEFVKDSDVEIDGFLWKLADLTVGMQNDNAQLVEFGFSGEHLPVSVVICTFRDITSNNKFTFMHALKESSRMLDLKSYQLIGSKEIIKNTTTELQFMTDSLNVSTTELILISCSLNEGIIPEDAKIGLLCGSKPKSPERVQIERREAELRQNRELA